MMYKSVILPLLSFAAVVCAAPALLDAATLLQNGEEAQALNRHFRTLKASDSCQDGQVACIGKSIAKCQDATWETTRGECSRSQFCFALPSVSSSGAKITCTSQKSAENLITATGATGGIFGNPTNGTLEVGDGSATQRASGTPSASYIMGPSTIVPDFTPAATSPLPSSTPGISAPDRASGVRDDEGSRPCTMHETNVPPTQPTPTVITDTTPSASIESIASTPQAPTTATLPVPSTSTAAPKEAITVTVTLIPFQPTTLAPETRIISPEEASSIVSSINAAAKSTTVSPAPVPSANSSASTSIPISVVDDTIPSPSSPPPAVSTQRGYGGY